MHWKILPDLPRKVEWQGRQDEWGRLNRGRWWNEAEIGAKMKLGSNRGREYTDHGCKEHDLGQFSLAILFGSTVQTG